MRHSCSYERDIVHSLVIS